jgi:2-polyprenyl-3-methyl-5-hydroxy-6-metoxy-1,4-benzoquinol methylase
MAVNPTLRCSCKDCHLEPAFSYDAPPPGETGFDLQGQSYRRRYQRCALCGHWFSHHDLDLSRLYERDYVDATYGGSDGLRQKFEQIMALAPEKSDNFQRVQRIRSFMHEHGLDKKASLRLLDVGSGLGVFPAAMQTIGWQATALETDTRTIKHLRGVVHVPTFDHRLDRLDPAAVRPFDLITFNKVLEHVEDPVDMLLSCKALLLHHGFIYVEVPDVAAAEAGPEREEFFIEHHHVFSPASVAMMAMQAGFQVRMMRRIIEPSSKFSLIAFLKVEKHEPLV